ncbi:MAG: flagellin lysine-N-methylase [Clostridia bacterium]|nr:flagellin lysine-N-methylase [Clostridia bacterium]
MKNMKLRAPKYFKDFQCIADKCKNSCCSAGWEIDIDNNSVKLYNKTNGEFGQKLKRNIDFNGQPHFKLKKNGTCPFLTKDKLCEIYINLGSNSLCHICKEHPRYYEWFEGIKECGIGLCCEEAARIILSQNQNFSTYETEIPYESVEKYDNTLHENLTIIRKKIIAHIENPEISFNSKMKNIISYGNSIQQKIYDNSLTSLEIELENTDTNFKYSDSLKNILKFLLNLETCNKDWIPYLERCINLYDDNYIRLPEFISANPKVNKYLENIATYFIWRYFLKATFDEDVLSKIGLMTISVSVIRYLFLCEWIESGNLSLDSCINIVRTFSEEIEYSEENLAELCDACYESQDFSSKKLKEIF